VAVAGPLIGKWHGTLTLSIAQKGQTPSTQSDETTFQIERGADDNSVVFWPNIEQKDETCRFVATVSGMKATFKPQKVCTQDQNDRVTTLSIKSGSLEQQGNRVTVKLELDASVRDKTAAKKAPPVTGVMTFSGTGKLVR
jgi:hypothetical protein